MLRRFTLSLMFLGLCLSVFAAQDKPEKTAKSQAEEAAKATVEGKWDKLADLTHPKVVELMGGRDKMVERMTASMKDMKAKGIAFNSAKIEDAATPVAAGKELYTYVPMTLEMKVPGGTITSKSFLLGVSTDEGKTWKFVDGSGIGGNEKLLKEVLPNLPKELKLPKKEKPVFQKATDSEKKTERSR